MTRAALVQTRAEHLLDDMAATGATFVQTGDGNGTADSLRLLDRKAGVHATLTIASPGWKLQLDARGNDRSHALAEIRATLDLMFPPPPAPAEIEGAAA